LNILESRLARIPVELGIINSTKKSANLNENAKLKMSSSAIIDYVIFNIKKYPEERLSAAHKYSVRSIRSANLNENAKLKMSSSKFSSQNYHGNADCYI